MKLQNKRISIEHGSTEYNIMHTILREFSGAKRNVMLHAFFVAHLNAQVKHLLANHVEGTQEFYNALQNVGSSQASYQEVFNHGPQDYPSKGLDLVRDFA